MDKGLPENILAIINNIKAKERNDKLSLDIPRSPGMDDGANNNIKTTNTLYFSLSNISKVFTRARNKKVFSKENTIMPIYKEIPVISSIT